MKASLIKINAFCKSLLLFLRPSLLFGFMKRPFLFFSNILSLSAWITQQRSKGILNDFYSPIRNYNKRLQLYQHILQEKINPTVPVCYLEFGVCGGNSFDWWLQHLTHADNRFYGFDTFEGLPENWGFLYKKGDMNQGVPELSDGRAQFVKGLFQDTLFPFIEARKAELSKKLVIHMDADLFTASLFSLTTLAPYLKKGDIILFDEFNTPNHEFFAWKIFVESFYIKANLIGAVNNYFQVAFEIQ